MIGVVLLVLFVHFGGTNVPKVLKDNKQIIYGVVIGLVLCSFFGVNIEGFWSVDYKGHTCSGGTDRPDGEAGPPDQTIIDAAATACQERLNEPRCSNLNQAQITAMMRQGGSCRSLPDESTCLNDCGLAYEFEPRRRWLAIGAEGTPPSYKGSGNTWAVKN